MMGAFAALIILRLWVKEILGHDRWTDSIVPISWFLKSKKR
jgi:hypothetical protein